MDVSGSMCSGDIAPNRLVAAEAAAASFIDSQAADSRIGIVAFSGFAEMVQAPTSDRDLLHQALQSLVTGRRTADRERHPRVDRRDQLGRPERAGEHQRQQSRNGATAPTPGTYAPDIIVLLTDGANNAGPAPADAAKQAADRGVRVFTIGFGTADGGSFSGECARQFIGNEPGGGLGGGFGGGGFGGGGGGGFRRGIDEDTLKEVATLTGGTYHPAESADQLKEVFAGLPTNLVFRTEAAEISVVFVALGVLAAAAGSLLGRLWRPLP